MPKNTPANDAISRCNSFLVNSPIEVSATYFSCICIYINRTWGLNQCSLFFISLIEIPMVYSHCNVKVNKHLIMQSLCTYPLLTHSMSWGCKPHNYIIHSIWKLNSTPLSMCEISMYAPHWYACVWERDKKRSGRNKNRPVWSICLLQREYFTKSFCFDVHAVNALFKVKYMQAYVLMCVWSW